MAVDDYLNVWWELDDDVLTVELEAEVDDDTWYLNRVYIYLYVFLLMIFRNKQKKKLKIDRVAFGPSPTGSMIPADVVVTGFHNGEPRALDYHLQGRSQCNYQSGANRGVCPDDAQGRKRSFFSLFCFLNSIFSQFECFLNSISFSIRMFSQFKCAIRFL